MLLLKPKLLSLILARWANEDVEFYLLAWHFSEPGVTRSCNILSVQSAGIRCHSSFYFVFENVCTLKFSICCLNCLLFF